MCGISGVVRWGADAPGRDALFRMIAIQHHRGPDGCAYQEWENVLLGHNRLKIIDLSADATQPMTNEDGRLWVVFNGEIYNFRELREELSAAGHRFRSRSDTEVLLHLYEERGEAMVERLNGIFAFALLDRERRSLFLARDPFGVKPLFFAHRPECFLFASEIKALLAAGVDRAVDVEALQECLIFSHVAGSPTLFRNVRRLLPGETLTLDLAGGTPRRTRYWTPRITGETPPPDAVDRLHRLLDEAVRRQMVADVPVGTMCSGGIDSSLVSALAARTTAGPLDTYVIQVEDPRFDETDHAGAVSRHIGSRHHVLPTRAEHADAFLPLAIWLHDEPLMHENSIPILQISLLAKEQVTVLLSGEGADEVYGGYGNQESFRTVRRLRRLLPPPLAALVEPFAWGLPRARPARLLQRVGAASAAESMALSASRASRGLLNHLGLPLRNGWAYRREVAETALRSTRDPVLAHILYDQQTYLQTLLDRQDRMSMGASIECRVPFLDLPTVEAVNGMGMAVRQRDGMNKWAIRRIGRDYLPPEIAARKKHAFGLPLAPWLRGSRAVAGRIAGLPRGSLVRAGVLPAPFARRIVDRWDRGNDGIATLIWNLANLEIWWELFQDGKEPENRHRLPSHPTRDRSASPAAIGA